MYTFWLHDTRHKGSDEILRSHVDLCLSVFLHFQCSKISKYLIWSRVEAYPVLILNYLSYKRN